MQQLTEEVPRDILIINFFPRMWREMVYFAEEYFVKLRVQMELKMNLVISPSPFLALGGQIRTLNKASSLFLWRPVWFTLIGTLLWGSRDITMSIPICSFFTLQKAERPVFIFSPALRIRV